MLANTTGGQSHQIMKILYNARVLPTLSYPSPVCAGPLIHRKWAFERQAGGRNRGIEPLHCAFYKVP